MRTMVGVVLAVAALGAVVAAEDALAAKLVSVDFAGARLEEVCADLTQQAGVPITCGGAFADRRVTLSRQNAPLGEVVQAIAAQVATRADLRDGGYRFRTGGAAPAAVAAPPATDVPVQFTLETKDAKGAPLVQTRHYSVYRPANLSRDTPAPMVLCMECRGGDYPAKFLHAAADRAGFIVVSCAIRGNSSTTAANPQGTSWFNSSFPTRGYEDMDYVSAVIQRVREAENGSDAFICGLSKGGHTAHAFACERPGELRAACSVDEFMGPTNIPNAPLPILAVQGTADSAVPYAMSRDTVDVWRQVDGLLDAVPVTTYESSPRLPGSVTQTTWRGGNGTVQVAFITVIGGTHTWPSPWYETGYDFPTAMFTFFSQFLTPSPGSLRIVAQPVDNVQIEGHRASFWVTAKGDGLLAYQWQRNGEDIPGATANWYTTPPVTPADQGATYRAVVAGNGQRAVSGAAALTVQGAPADPRIEEPPADQAVAVGQPVRFSVKATGSGTLSYQWQKNGMDIVGATEAAYAIPAAIVSDCGAVFRVIVTNDAGSAPSPGATLAVRLVPGVPVITEQPVRVRVAAGQPATFTVKATSATPMTYQWQECRGTTNDVDIPGATSATYTIPATTPADNKKLFRCIVTNAVGPAASSHELVQVR